MAVTHWFDPPGGVPSPATSHPVFAAAVPAWYHDITDPRSPFGSPEGIGMLRRVEAWYPDLLDGLTTLYGDARNGRRPSFTQAARPEQAEALYQQVATLLRGHGVNMAEGRFRTHMLVSLCNDGPVTILLDSQKTF